MSESRLNPRVRLATPDDLSAVDDLLSRAYPALLRPDYPPSTLITVLPIICRAQPELLASGSYFLAECDGKIAGAGGWTFAAPGGWTFAAPGGKPGTRGVGHMRHVATAPDRVRQGVGRALISNTLLHAKGSGVARMECLSTRTAVAFYAALGFEELGPVDLPLRAGITFPCVAMRRDL